MSGSTSRKKKPTKTVPKEALRVTALKKKETAVRAMAIIERMIEEKVEESWLLDSVHSITQDQYQDVVEERAITNLCGYPLCCGVLKDIPSKTYHISTKQNKVYDITDRKNYCSSRCYKASIFLKNQVLTSPLWLRDAEAKPEYTIFHLNEGSGLGAEVDLGHCRVRLSDVNSPAKEETNLSAENLTASPENKNSSEQKVRDVSVDEGMPLRSSKPMRVRFKENENSDEETLDDFEKDKINDGLKSLSISNSEASNYSKRDSVRPSISGTMKPVDEAESILCKLENLEIDETNTEKKLIDEVLNTNFKSMSEDLSISISDKECTESTSENKLCSEAIEKESTKAVIKNDSNLVPQESKGLKSQFKSELDSKLSEEKSAKMGENKTNEMFNSSKSLKSENLNNSSRVLLTEKCTQDIPKSKHTQAPGRKASSEPLKVEPSLKKQSVFKKERNKNVKTEEKVDRKTILLEIVKHIEKCIREWITFDSLIFLLGEDAVKNALKLKGSNFKDCQNFCGTDSSTYEKYLSICKKLNMLELEDARADSAVKEKNAELKPLPDYSLLQREAKQLEIKVRSFYEGSTRIEVEDEVVKDNSKEEDNNIVLPLVDLHAQKALRRRIVLDRLNVILPDLGRTLNLGIFNITSAVRNLSRTFNFSPHNITFKPPEWYFIAMVLVKLLSLQDKNMQLVLESGSSEKYLTLLLMNWGLDAGYLDRLVTWLTDIDNLLQRAS